MNLLTLGLIAIVLFVLEEFVFSASRYFWIGGIAPVLWTIFLGYEVVINAASLNVTDYLLAIIAVIVPYVCWGNGFQRRAAKRRAQ
ncbi:hypothetical protein ACFP3T_02965 [Lactiplantibacillus dongliensis]|uniref:Integral membrane protein n=1 Tax=Lactiplantibacillus dongliensis TaxID=2559919 RepID=A0ABW1R1I2_9LACO|nr:hypothetical protein [Lactiplantibacillus dongliensis]